MENNIIEIGVVEKIVARTEQAAVVELSELELAFVGGGIAELVGV